jgi:MoxR-like ATPase
MTKVAHTSDAAPANEAALALNWLGNPEARLSETALLDIRRHDELVGPVVELPNDPEELAEWTRAIADAMYSHQRQVLGYAREWFVGEGTDHIMELMYRGLVFGFSSYVEGTSGTGKTERMRFLATATDVPIAEVNARTDISDLEFVGAELPDARMDIRFKPGALIKPGALALMIDELPRLPGPATNVLLQAIAERIVVLNLISTGRPDHKVRLSPYFFVLGVGNPVGYGAQGERSLALFDRFGQGALSMQPPSEARIDMYLARASGKKNREWERGRFGKFGFTLREARAALRLVTFRTTDDQGTDNVTSNLLKRLAAASAAISPRAFRDRSGWKNCPYLEEFTKLSRANRDAVRDLEKMVEENLSEGSNPRGELAAVDSAQAIRLLDQPQDEGRKQRLVVAPRHMAQAFRLANQSRLKSYPGCEDQVEPLLDRACEIFFGKV